MKLSLLASALLACTIVFSSLPATGKPASADKEYSGKVQKPKKEKSAKAKAKKGGGVAFHDGSAESRSERERRLMRECKGRPSAGVCEGYTR